MKKSISIFLSVLMLLSVFAPFSAFATESGSCGDNATYEIKNGVLTISGTGKISNKTWLDPYRDDVKKVIVKEGITDFCFHCFENCKNLKTAYLPESLKNIRAGSFINCKKLEKADLPSNIKYIGASAFCNCVSLKKISIPNSVKTIYSAAFRNCQSAKGKLFIRKDMVVKFWAFRNCDGITEVTFEDGFIINTDNQEDDRIFQEYDVCFQECDNLKKVYIPGSMKIIPPNYFNDCTSLSNVTIDDGVETVGGFTNCESLKNITLPKSVKIITDYAFAGCPKLKIKIPYKVEKIGSHAIGYRLNEYQHINGNDYPNYEPIKNFKIYGKKCKALTDYCKDNGFKFIDMYDVKNATVKGLGSKRYTGKAIKPELTVKLVGTKLEQGTDFTVKYSNNTKVGTAKVTLKGKGKYKGTLTKTFKINPKPTELTKLTPKSKSFKAHWKKNKSQTSGYQLQYSTYKSFKNAKKVTVKGYKTGARTVKDLKSKKKYFVRVRAYKVVDGKKYYSKWSESLKVTTK